MCPKEYGHFGEQNISPAPGTEQRILCCPARNLANIPTEVFRPYSDDGGGGDVDIITMMMIITIIM